MSGLNEQQMKILQTVFHHEPEIECLYLLEEGLHLKPANKPAFLYKRMDRYTLDDIDSLVAMRMLRAAPDGEIIYPTRLGLQIGGILQAAHPQGEDMLTRETANAMLESLQHRLDERGKRLEVLEPIATAAANLAAKAELQWANGELANYNAPKAAWRAFYDAVTPLVNDTPVSDQHILTELDAVAVGHERKDDKAMLDAAMNALGQREHELNEVKARNRVLEGYFERIGGAVQHLLANPLTFNEAAHEDWHLIAFEQNAWQHFVHVVTKIGLTLQAADQ